ILRQVFFRPRQLPIYHRANYIGALARTSRGSVMKIVFSRWVGVDGVVLAPDYLDRQNADCGAASRFYRRGVAFRFQTGPPRLNRAMAHLGAADPDLTTNHWPSP